MVYRPFIYILNNAKYFLIYIIACLNRSSVNGACTVGKNYTCISGVGLSCSGGKCLCTTTVFYLANSNA